MFNPQQQQQFHQLIQLQHLLQQQQQQHSVQAPAHHPPTTQHPLSGQHGTPRAIQNQVQHQQQQQMLNLRPATPTRILNTHPMIQRALLMQQMQAGNLRGLNMVAPTMPPFFPTAARHSILGIPPMGVTVKAPSMAFPPLPFAQPRVYHKDHYKSSDRKKDHDHGSSPADVTEKSNSELPRTASEADENAPSGDTENLTECSITDPLEPSAKRARSSETCAEDVRFTSEGAVEEGSMAEERSVESQSPEGVSGGRGLKVTIQLRSESRTTALQPACPEKNSTAGSSVHTGPKFCCYVCKTSYHNLQNFQSHLVTAQHQHKMQEIEHLSNACLVTLLPTAKESYSGRDGKKKQLRWCNVCQVHYSCDLIKHRQTQEHKMAKRSLRPFCTVCCRHFKTPRKFVEHMKSPEHKWKSQEVKLREKEPWKMEESEELITVDAVGCFEEEEDDDEDDEEGISADDTFEDTDSLPVQGDDKRADLEEAEEYNPDKEYGLDYMVPVAGYLCRLCHKFYPSDSAARLTHCKSLVHFQNIQRRKAAKKRMVSQVALNAEDEKTKMAVASQDDGVSDKGNTGSTDLTSGNRPRFNIASVTGEDRNSIPGFDASVGTSEEDLGYQVNPKMPLVKSEQSPEGAREEDEEDASCRNDAFGASKGIAHQKLL